MASISMGNVVLDTTVIVKSLIKPPSRLPESILRRELETHRKCRALMNLLRKGKYVVYFPRAGLVEIASVLRRSGMDCDTVKRVIQAIENYVRSKLSEVARAINALSDIARIHLKLALYTRGYRGKHGFSVGEEGQRTFMKLLHRFKKVLRNELADLSIRNELDLAKVIEGVNRFRECMARASSRTIATAWRCIDEVSSSNPDFDKAHRLAKSVALELVRDFAESRS